MSVAEPVDADLQAADKAPIPWKRRLDFIARRQGAVWVLKDPVAERYFQISHEAYTVWQALTGTATVGEVCRAYARHFAPRTMTADQLKSFLAQLVGQGLVWGEMPVLADQIRSQRARRRRQANWFGLLNILAIRTRGVDPDRWLAGMVSWWGWLFSPTALLLQGVLLLSALLLVAVRWTDISYRLPEELAHWSVADLGLLAAVLAVMKGIHELGHGLACRRLGGEVHELGILWLVFTPCLYCDVSSAWLMKSRWHRMAVSAAGMWVESVVAGAALWMWWGSQPGWFHTLCLHVIFIGGVSTLLFNLNPLLKYDGYYLLADALGIANLQQQAQRAVYDLATGLLGLPQERLGPTLPLSRQLLLAAYAVTSVAYRITMVVFVLWMLHAWLDPQGLGNLSLVLAGLTILSMAVPLVVSVSQATRDLNRHARAGQLAPFRLGMLVAFPAILLFVPFPSRVGAPAYVSPARSSPVFVTMEGRLVSLLPAGTDVKAGEVIARLQNRELERELVELEGARARAAALVEQLTRRQIVDPSAAAQRPAAEKELADLTSQWQQALREQERLTIRAPSAGRLWPFVPPTPPELTAEPHLLTGSPFAAVNDQAWVPAGTQIAWIGASRQIEATAYVTQNVAARVSRGAAVHIWIPGGHPPRLHGRVLETSSARLELIDADLRARLKIPQVTDASGSHPVGVWYQIRMEGEDEVMAMTRGTAEVAISVPAESLVQRVSRFLRETFVTFP